MDQLTRGLSPRKAALAVALGAWLGVVPLLGATTLLCLLAGWLLRLNHAVLQMSNLLVYPLQLLLLIPFMDLGAHAFGGGAPGLDIGTLMARFKSAPWAVLREYGWIGVHGCLVWAVLGLLAVPFLSWILSGVFSKMAAGAQAPKSPVPQNI
jgi:hypothetical protein